MLITELRLSRACQLPVKVGLEANGVTLLLCLKVSRLQLLIDDDFDPDWLVGTLFLIYFHQVVKQFVANINNLDSHQRQTGVM